MNNAREYFNGKRVVVTGLRSHTSLVGDVRFLVKCGADVTIADVGKKADLEKAIVALELMTEEEKVGKLNYSFGNYDLELFTNANLVIKPRDVTFPNILVKAIEHNNVQVETPELLFTKLSPPVILVGVGGSAGKTTTALLIRDILERGKTTLGKNIFCVTNYENTGLISLLENITSGDIVIIELSFTQLRDFASMKMSPYVSVCPALGADEAHALYTFQSSNNYFVAPEEVIEKLGTKIRSRSAKAMRQMLPLSWSALFEGESMKDDVACAVETAHIFKISEDVIEEALKNFKALSGRLEYKGVVKERKIYNDGASVTPHSTLSALRTVSVNKNAVLIIGGKDVGEDMTPLLAHLNQYATTVIAIPGTGTIKIHKNLLDCKGVTHVHSEGLADAVKKAFDSSRAGDVILFSPAFGPEEQSRDVTSRIEAFDALMK